MVFSDIFSSRLLTRYIKCMQEQRGEVPLDYQNFQFPENAKSSEEESLPTGMQLVEDYVLWRPTLEQQLKQHGEDMMPKRTVEELKAEVAKKIEANRSIQLKEIARLGGAGVVDAMEGMEKALGIAFSEMTGEDWRNSAPDLMPGDGNDAAQDNLEAAA